MDNYIEVTNKTFTKVFEAKDFIKTTSTEHARTFEYANKEIEQHGKVIHNFISDVNQYYLLDINA